MRTRPRAYPCPRHRFPARSSDGFTLLELLVGIVLTGLLATVVLELFASQTGMVRLQGAREDVRQNGRAALELIVSELRSADPRGVVAAEPDGITFRLSRAWGVVCHHSAERLAVHFPAAAATQFSTGEERIALPPVGESSVTTFLEVFDSTGASAPRAWAAGRCAELDPSTPFPPGAQSTARVYTPRVPGSTLGIASGAEGLPPGTPVHLFDPVRYQVARPPGAQHFWIRRNTGPAMLMQPLAGPVPEYGGLVFRYRDRDGQVIADLSAPAARAAIASVEIAVTTIGATPVRGVVPRDSTAAVVLLRNRY
jgi:prepilin-type N-terminal cleavage/methylation domain-containing protein